MSTKTQIQKTRQYALAFGRGIYADILRWGESEELTFLCRANKKYAEDTYLDCLRRFYTSMKKDYRCEYVFKNEIIAELRKHYAHQRSLVVNEFHVGNSIADIAFFNGESRAYEIKTSYDTPRRLEGQVNDYRRVFDKCYIVVEQNEVDTWKEYDESIGIIAFCNGPRGKITMEEVRPAMTSEHIDAEVLMTCLRVDEYELIAQHYAGVRLSESKYKHFEECKAILQSMDERVLHDAFLKTIEKRKSSLGLLDRTPHELYQICMSMHLSDHQLDSIKSSLNNLVF